MSYLLVPLLLTFCSLLALLWAWWRSGQIAKEVDRKFHPDRVFDSHNNRYLEAEPKASKTLIPPERKAKRTRPYSMNTANKPKGQPEQLIVVDDLDADPGVRIMEGLAAMLEAEQARQARETSELAAIHNDFASQQPTAPIELEAPDSSPLSSPAEGSFDPGSSGSSDSSSGCDGGSSD